MRGPLKRNEIYEILDIYGNKMPELGDKFEYYSRDIDEYLTQCDMLIDRGDIHAIENAMKTGHGAILKYLYSQRNKYGYDTVE